MLKIAIAVKDDEQRIVPDTLLQAKTLFIIDAEGNEVLGKVTADEATAAADKRDVLFAKSTVEWDCEAVICGSIKEEAFEILAKEGITRYNGSGCELWKALEWMDACRLPVIRDFEGGDGCHGHEH